ncbi:pyridoxal phosphate-dependent aminotransferase family protein [Wenyingzhuangia sp. 1_MG-2023]|nr:pyridoxal phosphate-dependent aminotransferase family protein [Wenyingzhuangia sp. 1_MG-2023]
MYHLPNSLKDKLQTRIENNSLRTLHVNNVGLDFYSNDYLGLAQSKSVAEKAKMYLENSHDINGSTGSRLISGTHSLHIEVESELARFHKAESGLLFNSGYDANVGLFSSVLQKNDVLLFDELIHASVRDGIRLSAANSYKFKHNDIYDLETKILRFKENTRQVYISIETVYSMDGDTAPLQDIVNLCEKHGVYLIVDEAHSGGVFGENGNGLVCALGLETKIFARVHTFGKALGCHGAVVLGSDDLRNYLINFSRAFIYTTAIPLHAVATIRAAYESLQEKELLQNLHFRISYFNKVVQKLGLSEKFIKSNSAIHCCVLPGNDRVKNLAQKIQNQGVLVKPILSPTVANGQERLRICLHAFNTKQEIDLLLKIISENI